MFERWLEPSFGWIGMLTMAVGATLSVAAMILGYAGWEMSRLWLWLLGSALFLLVGMQLLISWIVARVMEELAEREELIQREMRDETLLKKPGLVQTSREESAQEAPVV
jgi:hypothetical protein